MGRSKSSRDLDKQKMDRQNVGGDLDDDETTNKRRMKDNKLRNSRKWSRLRMGSLALIITDP